MQDEESVKKEELDLIYDEDLMPVLEKLGIKDDFLNGKIKCLFCNSTITMENLSSFFLEGEIIKMVCGNENCIKKIKKGE